MPIHVTTSTTQSLSNKTFVDHLSTFGVVYANGGASNQWNSVYSHVNSSSSRNDSAFSTVNASSASWGAAYTTTNSKSANWDSVYSSFNTQSAANASVFSTVQTYSATSWNYQGTDIKALTANWESTYTDFKSQSAANTSVYSTTNSKSANWDSVYSQVYSLSDSWGTGGSPQTLSFNESNALLTISSGNSVSLSALSGSSTGSAIDVGVRALTGNWQSTYTDFSAQSANNASVYSTVNSTSANWNSVYSSFNTQSAANASVYSSVNSVSANWNSVYSSFNTQSAANASVYSTVNTNSATAFTRSTIGITIDGGGSVITTGSKGYISIPYSCIINSNTIVANATGDIVIDIKKSTYSGFPTTASICAAAKPTLAAAQKSTDSTLTGWTTTINSGDIIEFVVDSAATITKATLTLGVIKT